MREPFCLLFIKCQLADLLAAAVEGQRPPGRCRPAHGATKQYMLIVNTSLLVKLNLCRNPGNH